MLRIKSRFNFVWSNKSFLIGAAFTLAVLVSGCSSNGGNSTSKNNQEIYVSAAASLNQVTSELEKMYETAHPGLDLIINFGGSGTLQMQIEQGAPVDLFISAGEKQVNAIAQKGLIVEDTRTNLLQNDLVLIVPSKDQGVKQIEDLKNSQMKMAIGNPESVPAGMYAKQTLISYGLWDTLQTNLVFTKDVSQVRSYVETGNVEAGLVYASDVKLSDKVKVAQTIPDSKHAPIVYPAVVINNGKNPEGAKQFLDFLEGREAQNVFQKYGFKPGNFSS